MVHHRLTSSAVSSPHLSTRTLTERRIVLSPPGMGPLLTLPVWPVWYHPLAEHPPHHRFWRHVTQEPHYLPQWECWRSQDCCQSWSLQNHGQQTLCGHVLEDRVRRARGCLTLLAVFLPSRGCPVVSPDLRTSIICAFNGHNPHSYARHRLGSTQGR